MTIPYLENCPHCPDGWCLACVNDLADDLEQEKGRAEEAEAQVETYKKRIMHAMKILLRED